MARSLELMIGAGMLAAGLTGLIYAMPLISSSVAAKNVVFGESDVPATPSSIAPYVAIVIASTGLIVGGITLCAMSQVRGDNLAAATMPHRQLGEDETYVDRNERKDDGNSSKTAEGA